MTQRRLTDPLYIYADPMKGAAHDPISAALSVVFAGAATFGPFGAAIGSFTLFQSFLIRAGIGLALAALAPKPPRQQQQQRGYQVTAFGSALDHQVIYGETRIAGARVFDSATGKNNRFLHRVIAFAGHEVEGFTEVYLNDYKLTVNLTTGAVTSAQNSEETTNRYNNRVRIIARNGTDNQTAIPEMVDEIEEWEPVHRLRGIAYLYIRFEFDADVFPNGIPEITATVKGRKVFDPRTGATAWSDNPALCLRDYLTNDRFGMGATAGEIDDVLVAQAANVCEETVEGEKRYTLNGAFTTDAAPADILQNMLTSMGGLLWHAQGAWRMKPAYYTPPVLSLTNDDLRGGLQIQTRAARRDNFNTVRGTFRGAESDWQVTDYKPVTDAAFVAADGGFETAIDLDLPFTSSHLTAQRIARIALQQQREQITVSGRFGLRAFQVQVGDTVAITNDRLGWTNKEFEVVTWTFTLTDDLALEVVMTLRETSEEVYTPTPGAFFESNNTGLPSPFIILAPQNLQAVSSSFIATDGTYVNSIDVTWEAPDDGFVEFYEVEWRKSTETLFSGSTTSALEYIIPSVVDSATYVIRVRAVNFLNVRGPFATITFNAQPDLVPPGPVTSLQAVGAFRAVNLSWVNPTDLDLEFVEIWESPTASFGAASKIAIAFGTTFYRGNLDEEVTRYYWVRAVDSSGNASTFTGPAVATTTKAIDVTRQVFSSSGTWLKPTNAQMVYVEVLSGGGSGGVARRSQAAAAGGGAGGSVARAVYRAVDLPGSVSVVVGSGGSARSRSSDGASNGNAGGNSSFGALTVQGGGGGNAAATGSFGQIIQAGGGSSGYVSGGDGGGASARSTDEGIQGTVSAGAGRRNLHGGGGGGGAAVRDISVTASASGGASTNFGSGGNGVANSSPAGSGSIPGGGGGGCARSSGTATSGAGARGEVVVWTW